MADFDIVIHGGRLIDGTGNPWFYGDVAIKDGKIASIGKINPEAGKRAISAKGYVVTPGYIDMHTHSDQPRGRRRQRGKQSAPGSDARHHRRKPDRGSARRARSWKNIGWNIANATASKPIGRRLQVTSTR